MKSMIMVLMVAVVMLIGCSSGTNELWIVERSTVPGLEMVTVISNPTGEGQRSLDAMVINGKKVTITEYGLTEDCLYLQCALKNGEVVVLSFEGQND